jgi:GT2 family glycosyltransferase
MLTIILLDYHSAEDSVAYVKHLCEKIKPDAFPVSFVIVDNSCDVENFQKLSLAFSTIENLTWHDSLLEKKEYCGHDLYLWKNLQNEGYAKGNNLGAKIALEFIHADYYLFSNSDIVILDDYLNLDRLIEEFYQMDVGMVGPSIIGKDGRPQNPYKEQFLFSRWGYEYLLYPFARFLPACINSGDLADPFEKNPVFRVMGSFFVIPVKIFNDIGGFDEHTFLFAEELILAKRLQQKDYLVHYVPSVHLLHNHSATINKVFNYNQRLKQRFRSEMYYYRTYCHAKLYEVALITFIFRSFLLKKSVAFWLKNLMIGKKV